MTAPGARPRLVTRRTPLDFLVAVLRRPVAAISLVFLLGILGVSLLAPWLGFADPYATDYTLSYAPPSWQHPFGTDSLGRDVLSRLAYGGAAPLTGATITVVTALALGIPLGALAGYFGRITDRVVSYLIDVMMAIPAIIILLVVLTVFPNNSNAAMFTFGILVAAPIARLIRVETLRARTSLHVDAAKVTGVGPFAILVTNVLPLLAGPILVQTTILFGGGLLANTGLGFLGFGPPPPTPTWGSLITEASRAMNQAPWLLVPTGGVVILTVLALNLLGDTTRDVAVERWAGAPRARRVPRARSGAIATSATGLGSALLEVRGLEVQFGTGSPVSVVTDVSLDVREGEIVGLVGESGCGKSVTGRAIIGLLPGEGRISRGFVRFRGRDLVGASAAELRQVRGAGIAYISQNPMIALDPCYTVGDQVSEAVARHERLRGRAHQARVLELLESVGLSDAARVARQYPHQISGGMAQRVAIARAIAGRPALLIADEPTTALDVTVQAGILDLLRRLRAETGLAVVLITHDWGVVADICDRSIVMYAGEVVESAELVPLFAEPRHPYTEGLLRSNPRNAEPLQPLAALRGTVPSPENWPVGCRFAARCPYATDDCREAPIPLIALEPGRSTRCIHPERIVTGRAEALVPHD